MKNNQYMYVEVLDNLNDVSELVQFYKDNKKEIIELYLNGSLFNELRVKYKFDDKKIMILRSMLISEVYKVQLPQSEVSKTR